MAELGVLGPVSGRRRDISVKLTGLSYRQAASGRLYPYPDFGSEFIEALHARLVAPRAKGLFRSTIVCPSCESSLDAVTVGPVAVVTEIDLKRIAKFRVDVEMPGMTCPGCGQALVMISDRAIDSDLSDALIDAFNAAGMKPG